jgi:hypothetical protein
MVALGAAHADADARAAAHQQELREQEELHREQLEELHRVQLEARAVAKADVERRLADERATHQEAVGFV